MVLDPYPPPEARDAALLTLAHELGAEVVEYGSSVEGRPLTAARLGPPSGPAVVVCANIHGVEVIGQRVAMQTLRLAADHPLRERASLWVAPCLNPDGVARTWAQGGHGTLGELRCNARGVDLNRNFPRPYGAGPSRLPGAGSDRPQDATYRGPHALSEPETAALAALLDKVRPLAGVNLHAFMGTLIQPPVRSWSDWRGYGRLAAAFRQAQRGVGYRRLATPILDPFTGEQEDWQHHVLGCWAVCVECFSLPASYTQHLRAPSLFWRFNPRDPEALARRDAPAVLAWLQAALELGPPSGQPALSQQSL
jgi:hypothetical protein